MRETLRRRADGRTVPVLVLAAGLALGGCGGGEAESREAGPDSVVLDPTAIEVASTRQIRSGPNLSGTLEAVRMAAVRAEIGGSVVETNVEEGERVAAGQLLARIEDAAPRDAALSAQSGLRAAEAALQTARREVERAERLVAGGAIAERDLEIARNNLAAAQAQAADARARRAAAQKQLESTRVRAPIGGVVSQRAVNAGDVVAPGASLFTVIDPGSMQLAASVPAERLSALAVGTPVEFEVRGYPGRTFQGTVKRVNPAVDPATGQVPILVAVPNTAGDLIAGLFAEGQVQTESRQALVVPAEALDESGVSTTVLRLRAGVVERVAVRVGLRDADTERVEISAGVQAGDTLLVGAARSVAPGTRVEIGSVAAAAAPGGG